MSEKLKEEYLIYIPAPAKPENFDAVWLKTVGTCPNGVDPNIRFVWGMDRVEKFGNRQQIRYPDPNDKYVGVDRWILEGWQSPDCYDPLEWKLKEHLLGAFPRNGVWDFIEPLQDETGNFLPLTIENAAKMAYQWSFWKSKPHKRVVADLLAQRERIAELREIRWQQKQDELDARFIEDFDREVRFGARAAEHSKNLITSAFKKLKSGLIVPNK